MATEDEIKIVNLLADAWNQFQRLPEMHSSDKHEFNLAIHVCQTLIMAREAIRQNPELYNSEIQ